MKIFTLAAIQFLFFKIGFAQTNPTKDSVGCVVRQELTVKGNGILNRVLVLEGQDVKKGDKIIELDSRQYDAGMKEAGGAFDAAKANQELAEDALARLKKLQSGEAVTEQQLAEARIRVLQAKAVVRQAEGAYERVKILQEDSTLRALVDGKVRGLPTSIGLAVQAGQSLGRIDVVPVPNCAPTSQKLR